MATEDDEVVVVLLLVVLVVVVVLLAVIVVVVVVLTTTLKEEELLMEAEGLELETAELNCVENVLDSSSAVLAEVACAEEEIKLVLSLSCTLLVALSVAISSLVMELSELVDTATCVADTVFVTMLATGHDIVAVTEDRVDVAEALCVADLPDSDDFAEYHGEPEWEPLFRSFARFKLSNNFFSISLIELPRLLTNPETFPEEDPSLFDKLQEADDEVVPGFE